MKKIFLLAGMLFATNSAFATNCLCYQVPASGDSGGATHVYNTCTDGLTVNSNQYYTTPVGAYNVSIAIGQAGYTKPGTCEMPTSGCAGGNCQDTMTDSASFDFHLQAGGIDTLLYVCKVGWNEHFCKASTCNNNDDYMVVYNDNGTVKGTIKSPEYKTFTVADGVTSAKAYFNSINFGAGWYVQYCLNITKLTVGGPATDYYHLTDLIAKVDANVSVTPGKYMGSGAKDYFSIANLAWAVEHDCTGIALTNGVETADSPDVVWDELTNYTESLSTTNSVCINGQPGCQTKTCSWKVKFRETQTCLRPLKDADKCPGPDCVPYEGTIHTSVTTNTKFSCAEGTCN